MPETERYFGGILTVVWETEEERLVKLNQFMEEKSCLDEDLYGYPRMIKEPEVTAAIIRNMYLTGKISQMQSNPLEVECYLFGRRFRPAESIINFLETVRLPII